MKIKNEIQKSLLKASKWFLGLVILVVLIRVVVGAENALFWLVLLGVVSCIILLILLAEVNKY